MTEVNKTPEAVKPNEVKPNDATPVPEKGNAIPIDSNAPKAPVPAEDVKPETDKERKQA